MLKLIVRSILQLAFKPRFFVPIGEYFSNRSNKKFFTSQKFLIAEIAHKNRTNIIGEFYVLLMKSKKNAKTL